VSYITITEVSEVQAAALHNTIETSDSPQGTCQQALDQWCEDNKGADFPFARFGIGWDEVTDLKWRCYNSVSIDAYTNKFNVYSSIQTMPTTQAQVDTSGWSYQTVMGDDWTSMEAAINACASTTTEVMREHARVNWGAPNQALNTGAMLASQNPGGTCNAATNTGTGPVQGYLKRGADMSVNPGAVFKYTGDHANGDTWYVMYGVIQRTYSRGCYFLTMDATGTPIDSYNWNTRYTTAGPDAACASDASAEMNYVQQYGQTYRQNAGLVSTENLRLGCPDGSLVPQ
jgi:hypothetical protein